MQFIIHRKFSLEKRLEVSVRETKSITPEMTIVGYDIFDFNCNFFIIFDVETLIDSFRPNTTDLFYDLVLTPDYLWSLHRFSDIFIIKTPPK